MEAIKFIMSRLSMIGSKRTILNKVCGEDGELQQAQENVAKKCD